MKDQSHFQLKKKSKRGIFQIKVKKTTYFFGVNNDLLFQFLFEPYAGVEVEVICGFVE